MKIASLICQSSLVLTGHFPDRGSSSRGSRRRSSSRHRREARQRWNGMGDRSEIGHLNFRREHSLSSYSTLDRGRDARYKEEKMPHLYKGGKCRGQLSDSTDSEAEEKRTRGSQDKLSYTEYKRRRRRRDINRNLSKSIWFFCVKCKILDTNNPCYLAWTIEPKNWCLTNRNRSISGCEQDLLCNRSELSPRLRSSESSLLRRRHSPEHIYQSIGSDLGLNKAATASDDLNSISDKIGKNENHDSGRSVSPPPRRFFSREGSTESSG